MDSPFTVTLLNISNNNNTRLLIFPFFSSLQLSRVIAQMNHLIENETSLSAVITTLCPSPKFIIPSYKMLYYLITKQILYALYQQLISIPDSQKQAFGLHSYKYSINDTVLSFSFWGASRKRPAPDGDFDPNRIELRITEQDGIMQISGNCNHRTFPVGLRDYRIMQIAHDVNPVILFPCSVFDIVRVSCCKNYVTT